MISIRNSSLALLANLPKIPTATRRESINAENELSFTAVLDDKATANIIAGNVVECEGDYFDIIYYQSQINEDGIATINVEAEHVSYRLNNTTNDTFGMTGTPAEILTAILGSTGFTVGTVEPTASGAYTINEKTTRRGLLIGYANAIGAELQFDKFEVSLLTRRGADEPRIFTAGKNLRLISKTYNGRQSPALVSYEAEPIGLPDAPLSLGDDVLLAQPELALDSTLRIITLAYNPMDSLVTDITISNYIVTLENQFYTLAQTSVTKDKTYNGCKIGPEEGFVAERSDGNAKAVMNATEGFALYVDTGGGLAKVFYVDLDGKLQALGLQIDGDSVFNGTINASQLIIGGEAGDISYSDLADKPNIPSEDDVVTIVGNTVTAPFVNALSVKAGSIDAEDITAGTIIGFVIVGSEIKTAASGERLVIDSANRVLFYNSSDVAAGSLKLDSGYLRLQSIDGTPLKIQSVGANMSIGAYGTGFKLYFDSNVDGGGYTLSNVIVDGYATQSWVEGKGYVVGNGISGTFTTVDGKTVTVSNGLITGIA